MTPEEQIEDYAHRISSLSETLWSKQGRIIADAVQTILYALDNDFGAAEAMAEKNAANAKLSTDQSD